MAGIAEVLFYNATDGTVTNLNGQWNAPQQPFASINDIPPTNSSAPNGASILVGGFMAVMEDMYTRFGGGALSWSELLEPGKRRPQAVESFFVFWCLDRSLYLLDVG